MSIRRSLSLTLALTALAPGTAAAEDVRVVARDVPLAAARASTARPAPLPFTMVGIHWQGSGKVWFRTAARPGRFGPWRSARPEAEDGPDVSSDELDARAGWRIGNPWWTGPARWIEYRVAGEVTRLRTFYVDSPVTPADRAPAASAGKASSAAASCGPCAATGDREARRVERRRDDRAGRAGDRGASSPCRGTPHGRLQQLFPRRVSGHRARNPALSRPRKRLGRHRLQLPRRQVRPCLRRPWRRDHPRT